MTGIFLILFAQPMVTYGNPETIPHGDRAADGVQRLRRHNAHGTREAACHKLRGQRHDEKRSRAARGALRRFLEGERGTRPG